MGRHSSYTQKVADEICLRLSKGEPLADICRDDHMPAVRTVSDWRRARQAFAADFACARDEGYDAIAQRARLTLRGYGPDHGGDSTGDVQRDKAIADFDLKLLSKWDPRRYGDRLEVEQTVVTMTPEQRQAEIDRLLAKRNGAD